MHTDEQHMCPPRMLSNAVGGGGDCTLSLAWDGAVMMPLQYILYSILIHTGKGEEGGRESLTERRLERGATIHKAGSKIS